MKFRVLVLLIGAIAQVPGPPPTGYTRETLRSPHTGKTFGLSYREYTVDLIKFECSSNDPDFLEVRLLIQQQEEGVSILFILQAHLELEGVQKVLKVFGITHMVLGGPGVHFYRHQNQYGVYKFLKNTAVVYLPQKDAKISVLFKLADELLRAVHSGRVKLDKIILGHQNLILWPNFPSTWYFIDYSPITLEKALDLVESLK